jgi:hypothetical protein
MSMSMNLYPYSLTKPIHKCFEAVGPFIEATLRINVSSQIDDLTSGLTFVEFLSCPFEESTGITGVLDEEPILTVTDLGIICQNLKIKSFWLVLIESPLRERLCSLISNPTPPEISYVLPESYFSFRFIVKYIHRESFMITRLWYNFDLK